MVYFISRLIYKIILKLFFKFEVIGKENIPKKGPFIMVSNHVSYTDPIVMGVTCYTAPVAFLAKRELLENFFLGTWCKLVGCIFIERYSGSSKPLKKVLKRLKEGGVIGIFPEGKRSRDGKLQKAEPGVGIIAAKSGVSIIPMYISGTDKALPIGSRFPRPCKITATVGKPVDISGYKNITDRRKVYEFIGEKIMEAIGRLKEGADQLKI